MRILKNYLSLSILLLLFPVFISAQISVSKIDGSFNPGSKDGLVYSLPQTLITVTVTVEQRELLAGPLRNYAEEYLGITNVISQNGFDYSIKDIKLGTLAEPDPKQYYYVSMAEKSSKANWKSNIYLNGHGMITSMNPAEEASGSFNGHSNQITQDEVMQIFRHYADLNMYAKVDTIVRTINIDTITIEDYTFRTTMTDKPLEVKAEETARTIQKIREGRYNLLTGYQEVNYSEGAIRFMSAELEQLEADYLRLFTGAVIRHNLTYTFTYLPTPETSGSKVIVCSLSPTSGITEGEGLGQAIFVEVKSSGNTATIAGSNLKANAASNGLFYRIPEEAIVKLIYQGKIVAQLRMPISQLGTVSALPATAMDVEFDGNTGGLKSMKLEAE